MKTLTQYRMTQVCVFSVCLGLLVTAGTQASLVPTEVSIIGEDGTSYLLDGAASHYFFNAKVEELLRERLVRSAVFIQNSSTAKKPDFAIPNLNIGEYSFLMLLNSFAEEDPMMINIITAVLNTLSYDEKDFPNDFLKYKFKFAKETISKALHFAFEFSKAGNSVPKFILDKLIYITETKFTFEEACYNDETDFVKWMINLGFDINQIGPEVTKNTWLKGLYNTTNLLISKGAFNNAFKTRAIIHARNEQNETLLHTAVEFKFTDTVIQLLKAGADVNAEDHMGRTALYKAVENGNTVLFYVLLDHGAAFNNGSIPRNALLQLALTNGNAEMVRRLIDLGADVNAGYKDHLPPLYTAVLKNDTGMISALIERGANINAKVRNGEPLLFLAVSENNLEAVNMLLRRGTLSETENDKGITPLHVAIENDNAAIIAALVEIGGANVNMRADTGDTFLHFAASRGSLRALNELIRLGALLNIRNSKGDTPLYTALDGNHTSAANILASKIMATTCLTEEEWRIEGNSLLHVAAADGKENAVKFFLKYGLKIDLKNNRELTPLYLAAQNGHIGIIKVLLQNGANMYLKNKEEWPFLHIAVMSDDLTTAKTLLEAGYPVDFRGKWKYTALHLAVRWASSPLVNLLLEKGAYPNAKDHSNKTPLYEATWYGKLDYIKSLLAKGADPNISSDYWAPIHLACRSDRTDVLKVLLDAGSDPNATTPDNKTPMYESVWWNHPEYVKLLLEKGGKSNITTTNDGETALSLAKSKGLYNIVKIIEEYNKA